MRAETQSDAEKLPPEMDRLRITARKALGDLQPAGPPASPEEPHELMLSSRTNGGERLPPFYLVYFLLVDLLGFPYLGRWEKTAWTVPVRYRGRLYGIEHRKFGVGIFAPNLMPSARTSGTPTEQNEMDAQEICGLISSAVDIAEPYFEWRAERAASGAKINVVNKCAALFERYAFFRDRYKMLAVKAMDLEKDGSGISLAFQLRREAEWNAQAAVEAFFSWTEHAFIHLAILLGRVQTGDDVARLAEADWKAKFKAALDVTDSKTKQHYDSLLDLRAQIRNFMAHGAFGKRGEAFNFHSGAGAVPVLLTLRQRHRYSVTGRPAFREETAIAEFESFIAHLWSGSRLPGRIYLDSSLPSILTLVADGTYASAMASPESMKEFVDHLTREMDRAADMDW